MLPKKYYISQGLVNKTKGITNAFDLMCYIKSVVEGLNIPYTSSCDEDNPNQYPVRFFFEDSELQYYNGSEWVKIEVGSEQPQYYEFWRAYIVGTPPRETLIEDQVVLANGSTIQDIEDSLIDGKATEYRISDVDGYVLVEPTQSNYDANIGDAIIYAKIQANNFNSTNMSQLTEKLDIMIAYLATIEQNQTDSQREITDPQVKPVVTKELP